MSRRRFIRTAGVAAAGVGAAALGMGRTAKAEGATFNNPPIYQNLFFLTFEDEESGYIAACPAKKADGSNFFTGGFDLYAPPTTNTLGSHSFLKGEDVPFIVWNTRVKDDYGNESVLTRKDILDALIRAIATANFLYPPPDPEFPYEAWRLVYNMAFVEGGASLGQLIGEQGAKLGLHFEAKGFNEKISLVRLSFDQDNTTTKGPLTVQGTGFGTTDETPPRRYRFTVVGESYYIEEYLLELSDEELERLPEGTPNPYPVKVYAFDAVNPRNTKISLQDPKPHRIECTSNNDDFSETIPPFHPDIETVPYQLGYQLSCGRNMTDCIPAGWTYRTDPLTNYTVEALGLQFQQLDYGVSFPIPLPQEIIDELIEAGVLYPNWGHYYAVDKAIDLLMKRYPEDDPQYPLESVGDIPFPGDVDPNLSEYDERTTPVALEAFHPLSGGFQLMGWFIEGSGPYIGDMRPLLGFMNGIEDYIAADNPVNAGTRKFAFAMADAGFDVLFIDKPGHGWSGGTVGASDVRMYFSVLDQLADKGLLSGSAKETPVILSGYSLGAQICTSVMAANINPSIFGLDVPGPGYMEVGYNLKGMIDLEGLPGGLKFTTPGAYRLHLGLVALSLQGGDNYASGVPSRSEIVATLPQWPAFMCVTTDQNYQSPENAVYAFNIARGLKKIMLLEGQHGDAMVGENLDKVIEEAILFARSAVSYSGNLNHKNQVTLESLICKL